MSSRINKFMNYKNLLAALFLGVLLCIGLTVYSLNCKEKEIEFSVYNDGIYVVSIDSDYFAKNSDVYVSDSLEKVETAAPKNNAKVAINAGFFDPINGKTISFLSKNNEIVLNPENNERLMQSEELKPYIDKIFNRSEFRFLNCPIDKIAPNGEIISSEARFEINNHNEPLPPENYCSLIYSIQAGPELVPEFKLEDEFFVLKNEGKIIRQSASSLSKVARSAIGIKDDRILLVVASNQSPMTLEELADFMKGLGAQHSMAFDGGSSTSLYVDIPKERLIVNSAKDNSARKVKTILLVK